MTLQYRTDLVGIEPGSLQGFFEGWPSPPSPETHLQVLQASSHRVLAWDPEVSRVVGFVTAIGDGILAAYIPLLEVLRDHRGQGVGTELMRRMLEELSETYMVDLICDGELEGFYRRLGFSPGLGMLRRNRNAPALGHGK